MSNKTTVILLNAFPDKKIKSFGNKCLLKVTDQSYVIDYHIQILKKIFRNPQIIVVGGFDSKRLHKYIYSKFNKRKETIQYIEHDIVSDNNIGESIVCGMSLASHNNIFIMNSSLLLTKKISSLIRSNESFITTRKTDSGNIGFISDNNKIIHCYYGLPNEIIDILYISKKDTNKFNQIISDSIIKKLYLFEIINLCIQNDIAIHSVNIPNGSIYHIDSCTKIKNLQKFTKKYV